MNARTAQWLMVLTPVAAIATVGVGLRVGASPAVRAAVVYGARSAGGSNVHAWPIVVFDEDRGLREPVAGAPLDVWADVGGRRVRWQGTTNEDGAAEILFEAPSGPTHLRVESKGITLAEGDAPPSPTPSTQPAASAWARFARRQGDVILDVAVLGQRAASGFPASIWVHATDGATRASVASAVIAVEPDASLTPATTTVTTDDRGWAHVTATPLGYAVPIVLHATAADGRTGEWAGGLFVSPGGSGLVTRDLYAPGEPIGFELRVPTTKTTSYVEVDDARGRAWAAAVALAPPSAGGSRTQVVGPTLGPGLYWVVAAGDPEGAATLGPGTMARPFFVASSPDDALGLGTDPQACAPAADVRAAPRAVAECLAVVAPAPVPRWVAVDGFVTRKARDARQRSRGMAIALGAILVAILLEAVLLLRAAALARDRLRAAEALAAGAHSALSPRAWSVTVGVLIALMGFALLAAFVVRLA